MFSIDFFNWFKYFQLIPLKLIQIVSINSNSFNQLFQIFTTTSNIFKFIKIILTEWNIFKCRKIFFLSASEANALLHIYISNRVLSLFFGSYLSFPRHFYQVIWVQIDSISSKIDSKRFNHFITKRINSSSNTFNWFK